MKTSVQNKAGRKHGYVVSLESRLKISRGHRGKILTQEHKKQISETLKKFYTDPVNTPRWLGGKFGYWKVKALKRDNYTCQGKGCGISDREVLVVDHIIPVAVDKSKECELSNLITLCANCHIRKSRLEAKTKIYGRWK